MLLSLTKFHIEKFAFIKYWVIKCIIIENIGQKFIIVTCSINETVLALWFIEI